MGRPVHWQEDVLPPGPSTQSKPSGQHLPTPAIEMQIQPFSHPFVMDDL
jgi:hypothetical protein